MTWNSVDLHRKQTMQINSGRKRLIFCPWLRLRPYLFNIYYKRKITKTRQKLPKQSHKNTPYTSRPKWPKQIHKNKSWYTIMYIIVTDTSPCTVTCSSPRHPFFYTRSYLSALPSCALIFSTNFQFIFTFKYCTTQFSHWIMSCTKNNLIFKQLFSKFAHSFVVI